MFIAWVNYYLFVRDLRSSGRSLLQIGVGILMGVSIQSLSGVLSSILGGFGFPIAVFLLIGSLAYLSQIKGLNNIPAWFLGLIIFFCVHPEIDAISILELLIPVIAGFLFARLNDYGLKSINRFKIIRQ